MKPLLQDEREYFLPRLRKMRRDFTEYVSFAEGPVTEDDVETFIGIFAHKNDVDFFVECSDTLVDFLMTFYTTQKSKAKTLDLLISTNLAVDKKQLSALRTAYEQEFSQMDEKTFNSLKSYLLDRPAYS